MKRWLFTSLVALALVGLAVPSVTALDTPFPPPKEIKPNTDDHPWGGDRSDPGDAPDRIVHEDRQLKIFRISGYDPLSMFILTFMIRLQMLADDTPAEESTQESPTGSRGGVR